VLGCTVTVASNRQSDESDSGGNGDYLREFSNIAHLVLTNYVGHSIDLNTFVQLSKSLDIPYESVKKGYETFIKNALKGGRIRSIPSCYETSVWEVIG
jgi:hypothetical protein